MSLPHPEFPLWLQGECLRIRRKVVANLRREERLCQWRLDRELGPRGKAFFRELVKAGREAMKDDEKQGKRLVDGPGGKEEE